MTSVRECAICEETGIASSPLRWRRTLNGRDKLLVHAACYDTEVAHLVARQSDDPAQAGERDV